jgi:hypothetical protein
MWVVMGCKTHYVDNQGFCHRCGMPMNFDYWLASIGPKAYRNWEQHLDEWETLISDWVKKQTK